MESLFVCLFSQRDLSCGYVPISLLALFEGHNLRIFYLLLREIHINSSLMQMCVSQGKYIRNLGIWEDGNINQIINPSKSVLLLLSIPPSLFSLFLFTLLSLA